MTPQELEAQLRDIGARCYHRLHPFHALLHGGTLETHDFGRHDTLPFSSKRPPLARRDSDFALDYVKREAKTPDAQQAVLKALEFKCDVLWAMLDALYHAYVAPKHIPPGAFVPQDWRSA